MASGVFSSVVRDCWMPCRRSIARIMGFHSGKSPERHHICSSLFCARVLIKVAFFWIPLSPSLPILVRISSRRASSMALKLVTFSISGLPLTLVRMSYSFSSCCDHFVKLSLKSSLEAHSGTKLAQNFLLCFGGRMSLNSFSASLPELRTSSVSKRVAARRLGSTVCSRVVGL